MKLTPVTDSTLVAAHGHDPDTGKMHVQLKDGSIYEYDNVPVDRYAAFTGAKSMGQYLNARIKPNHEARKLPGKPAKEGKT